MSYLATGQLRCYDAAGGEVPCPGSGQDGESQCGEPWPTPRFVVEGEVVRDRLTDLIWSRTANPAGNPLMWQEALDVVAALNRDNAFGFHDWRMPNRHELRSLVSHQMHRPALPEGHPFIDLFPSWYWSSTTAAISPSHAWYVQMDGARMFYGGKDQSFLLWPVRGAGNGLVLATGQTQCHNSQGVIINCQGTGQDGELRCGKPWPKPRFVQQGEVIIDRLTTLAWRRNADLTGRVVRWQDALRAVQQLNEKQPGARWRLPNINELESLVDCRMYAPALPVDAVFTDLHGGYWSSTTSVYEPDWAWVLYLDKGAVGVAQKSGAYFHVWAVRSYTPSG